MSTSQGRPAGIIRHQSGQVRPGSRQACLLCEWPASDIQRGLCPVRRAASKAHNRAALSRRRTARDGRDPSCVRPPSLCAPLPVRRRWLAHQHAVCECISCCCRGCVFPCLRHALTNPLSLHPAAPWPCPGEGDAPPCAHKMRRRASFAHTMWCGARHSHRLQAPGSH